MKLELAALKTFMVLKADGSVDHTATHNKLTAMITEFELRNKDEDTLAARAVSAVFDKYKGSTMSTDACLGFAMRDLQVTPDNWGTMETAMKRYLKANTGSRGSLFGTGRGKGIWRWVDQAADKT